MFTIQSKLHLDHITGIDIFNFLINPDDREYQRWWPGTHLEYRLVKHSPHHVGDVVYMDEYVGKHRLKMTAIVTEAQPGKKIVWQMRRWIRLPVRLSIELEDDNKGVVLTHTIWAGAGGVGKIFDRLLRVYLSDEFAQAMDEHCKTEFAKLSDVLKLNKQAI
jgi:hypothetical protein